jgi:hypothetical protein
MAPSHDGDEELARDIGYALGRSPFRLKRGQNLDTCTDVARDVVAQLRRSLWLFKRAPVDAPHSTSTRKDRAD